MVLSLAHFLKEREIQSRKKNRLFFGNQRQNWLIIFSLWASLANRGEVSMMHMRKIFFLKFMSVIRCKLWVVNRKQCMYLPYQYVYKIGHKCAIWIFTKQKQAVLLKPKPSRKSGGKLHGKNRSIVLLLLFHLSVLPIIVPKWAKLQKTYVQFGKD